MPLFVYGALERDVNAAVWAGLLLVAVAAAALGVVRWLGRALDAEEERPSSR